MRSTEAVGQSDSGPKEYTDVFSPEVRSRVMAAVGQHDTTPELQVRQFLWNAGFRYRVRNRDLPGSPDIANRSRAWAVFVHGCFWHGHKNCPKMKSGSRPRLPKSNREFWASKIDRNRRHDAAAARGLRRLGYTVVVIWECQLKNEERLGRRLLDRLRDDLAGKFSTPPPTRAGPALAP